MYPGACVRDLAEGARGARSAMPRLSMPLARVTTALMAGLGGNGSELNADLGAYERARVEIAAGTTGNSIHGAMGSMGTSTPPHPRPPLSLRLSGC